MPCSDASSLQSVCEYGGRRRTHTEENTQERRRAQQVETSSQADCAIGCNFVRRVDDEDARCSVRRWLHLREPGQQLFVRPADRQFQQLAAGHGQVRQESRMQERGLAAAGATVQDYRAVSADQRLDGFAVTAAVTEKLRIQRRRQERARADERVAPGVGCWNRVRRL